MNTHTTPRRQIQSAHQLASRGARRALQRGLTFVELLTTLSIAAVLLSLAAPSMAAIIDSVKLSSTTNLFMSSLRLARSESLKRGGRVALCKSADGVNCELMGGWDQGWIIFHDTNGNGGMDAGEKLVERVEPLASSLRMTGNQNVARYISYWSGSITRTASGAMQSGTLTICHSSGKASEARQIVISAAGRARVQVAAGSVCA